MINCIFFQKACTAFMEGEHLISEKCALCKRNIHIHQELMEAELDVSTGYEKKGDTVSCGKRNGHSPKTLKSR